VKKLGEGRTPVMMYGGLVQTLLFNVCDLPKAAFAEGCDEVLRLPPWSLREIADSKLRSLRQPADMKVLVNDIAEGTARLLHVAEIHEKRTSRLEDQKS
jgi:hypothetical protein